MTGSFYAVLTAVTFALNAIFIRRAVLNISDASLGTLFTVPIAVPFFFIFLAVTGQLQTIFGFSWQGYAWLSLAGIINFVTGRSLYYKCVQLVGANIANILRRVNILVSVVIGISLLHEPLSWQLAFGVLLIMSGITLAGINRQTVQNGGSRFSKIPFNRC